MLRRLFEVFNRNQTKIVVWAEFWFNANYNISTKMSPFKALYGQEPPLLVKGADIPSRLEKVNQLSKDRDELL